MIQKGRGWYLYRSIEMEEKSWKNLVRLHIIAAFMLGDGVTVARQILDLSV